MPRVVEENSTGKRSFVRKQHWKAEAIPNLQI
jgi:hypothetical protein